jgi:hypothetical protein
MYRLDLLIQNHGIIDQVDFCFLFIFLRPILKIFITSIDEYFDTFMISNDASFADYLDSFLFALGKFSNFLFFMIYEIFNDFIYSMFLNVCTFFK